MALREYLSKQTQLFWAPPEDVLPPDHLCFVIDEIVEQLDFSSLPDRSKTRGHPAYDPRLLTKILFYGYATGTFSSRALMRACREHLPYTFLTRQQFPDFRTISDFRKDNRDFVERAFVQIVKLAQELGLRKMGTVALDSTKIKANASRAATLRDEKLEEEIDKALKEAIEIDREEDKKFGRDKTGEEQPEGLRSAKERLRRLKEAKKKLEEKERAFINVTDPETTFESKGKALIPSYTAQAAISEDGIIVDASVRDNPSDSGGLPEAIEHMKENLEQTPDRLLADSGYYSIKNLKLLKEEDIEGYIPSQQQARDSKDKYEEKPFSREHFTYDPKRDLYICPSGKELLLWRKNKKYINYRGISCTGCPCEKECIRGKSPYRIVSRSVDEQVLEEMRERIKSEEGKLIYAKRKTMIEPLFGHIKHNLRFRQFMRRGRQAVQVEWLLLCIGKNIRTLAKNMSGKSLLPVAEVVRLPKVGGVETLHSALSQVVFIFRALFRWKRSVPSAQNCFCML